MRALAVLDEVAQDFDALVFDQWGVLHDGSAPYPGAVAAVERLSGRGVRMAVLSNSGKRGTLNAARIASMGYDPAWFEVVMTSGEALWRDAEAGRLGGIRSVLVIAGGPRDAAAWADGLDLALTDDVEAAQAVLLMGLADGADPAPLRAILARARARGLPLYCSNPDRAAPRAGGRTVTSPGALAHEHAQAGGDVLFYGKPHGPVFAATARALGDPARLLMIGDSPEHDIAGGAGAGWATCLVRGGLHAADFADGADEGAVARVSAASGAPMPDFTVASVG